MPATDRILDCLNADLSAFTSQYGRYLLARQRGLWPSPAQWVSARPCGASRPGTRSTYSPWCLQPGRPPRRRSTSEVSLLANPVNYLAYNPKIRSYAGSGSGSGSGNTKMSDNAYNRTASHSVRIWAIFRQVNFQSGPALRDRCKVLSPFDLLLRLVISLAFMVANEASARNGAAPNNALAP
jgi:hypothetical protein